MRILELSLHHSEELVRIMLDAAIPPIDRACVEHQLCELDHAYDLRTELSQVPEQSGLLEFTVTSPTSGNHYGVVFIDMGHVADAVAYWRDPPVMVDPVEPLPHGYSRRHALQRAHHRLEDPR